MSGRPRVKPRRREKPCRRCGRDEWAIGTRGKWRCLPCDRNRQRPRTERADRIAVLWQNAKTRARKAGVPFSITRADIVAAWPADERCPALGLHLSHSREAYGTPASPSLDRMNPEWGYVPGNIAIISLAANRLKGEGTAAQLEQVAAWMRRQGLE